MIRPLLFSDISFLLTAAGWTIALTGVSLLLGGVIGLCVALGKVFGGPFLRNLAGVFVETMQSVPILMLLFLSFYGLRYLGLVLPPLVAAGGALSLFTGAYVGEIWRGSIEAVGLAQWEASEALAMSRFQQCRHVIFPQAIGIALPPTVGFIAQLIKNTSVAALIGFNEVTRAGQILNNMTFRPFQVFSLVAVIYFAICYPLSAFSRWLEERLNAHRAA